MRFFDVSFVDREEFWGEKLPDKYRKGQTENGFEVLKNPKRIDNLESFCRGIVDKNGDLYVIDDNLWFVHDNLANWLRKEGIQTIPYNI